MTEGNRVRVRDKVRVREMAEGWGQRGNREKQGHGYSER